MECVGKLKKLHGQQNLNKNPALQSSSSAGAASSIGIEAAGGFPEGRRHLFPSSRVSSSSSCGATQVYTSKITGTDLSRPVLGNQAWGQGNRVGR